MASRATANLSALERDGALTRPVALAQQHLLPVSDELAGLFVEGALRRGSTVSIAPRPGAASVALALAAAASQAGSWVAVVAPDRRMGLVAAKEAGVCLERVMMIVTTSSTWAAVMAAAVDAVEVIITWTPRVSMSDLRRLAARQRERGAVIISMGTEALESDVRIDIVASHWFGLGDGHGHLAQRRWELQATGRRGAERPRRITTQGAVVAMARHRIDA